MDQALLSGAKLQDWPQMKPCYPQVLSTSDFWYPLNTEVHELNLDYFVLAKECGYNGKDNIKDSSENNLILY